MSALSAAGKEVTELPGVMPNPTTDKLYEVQRWRVNTTWT